jgi:hypothetical protein
LVSMATAPDTLLWNSMSPFSHKLSETSVNQLWQRLQMWKVELT